jgi:RNA polymerase sigma-70 factor (ECF subfamily)
MHDSQPTTGAAPLRTADIPADIPALFHFARERRGDLAVSLDRFRERLQPCLDSGRTIDGERAADLYLACACEDGHEPAIRLLEKELMPGARAAMARLTRSEHQLDDAMQELRRRLVEKYDAKLAGYSGRGPLWKWIRITATRTVQDFLKSKDGRPAGSEELVDHLLKDPLDPETEFIRQRYQGVFRQALSESLCRLGPRERTLLRLRYVEKQEVDQLAVSFRAHRATIHRWLQAIRDTMLEGVQDRLRQQVPELSRSETFSIWRAIRSQVHISFARLVDTPPAEDARPDGTK